MQGDVYSNWVLLENNSIENAYKILDIIKELKSNHTGCYYDKICNVAERKYVFGNWTTENSI